MASLILNIKYQVSCKDLQNCDHCPFFISWHSMIYKKRHINTKCFDILFVVVYLFHVDTTPLCYYQSRLDAFCSAQQIQQHWNSCFHYGRLFEVWTTYIASLRADWRALRITKCSYFVLPIFHILCCLGRRLRPSAPQRETCRLSSPQLGTGALDPASRAPVEAGWSRLTVGWGQPKPE